MVLLVLAALGVLSALALSDAHQAWRAARFAEDQVRARALAFGALGAAQSPPDIRWLCLQPPASPIRQSLPAAAGGEVDLAWWWMGGGSARALVSAQGAEGGRYRLLVSLRVDSVSADSSVIGCPAATRLLPDVGGWFRPVPGG